MTFNSALQRAAVFVTSLPKESAAKILSRLESDELHRLLAATKQCDETSSEQFALAQKHFIDETKSVAKSIDPFENRKEIENQPFSFLEGVSNSVRYDLLKAEHPKVISSVLSFLSTDSASELLSQFEPQYRVSILKRLCHLEGMDKEKMLELSNALKYRLDEMLAVQKHGQNGFSIASKILSCADKETQDFLLEHIEGSDQFAAQKIRAEIIQFEEIQNLRDSDVKTILRFTDTSLWAPALQGATSAVQRKILNNFSERPRNILRQEIKASASVDTITSNQARLHIVKSMLKLSDQNLIRLERKSQDDRLGRAA